jgi:hypothetical protein
MEELILPTQSFTIDFANDLSLKVFSGLTAATGTYAASSQTDVF